jgi:hypothetical protein
MQVFDKVLLIVKGHRVNGHAAANAKNIQSLLKAKKEIEELLK